MMLYSKFYPGAVTTLYGTFTDTTTGEGVDPGTVTLHVQRPDGTVDAPTVIRASAGQYTTDYTMPVAGTYTQRWVGTSPYPQVTEATFVVLPSGIT